jgi:preprotein translocase subunit SecB
MTDIKKSSPFKFTGFLVEESHIVRKPAKKEKEFTMELSPKGIITPDKRTFQLELGIHVFEKNGRFDAKVKAIGFFSFNDVVDTDSLSNYFYTNAPAIIFPYVRAYIAALTSLSGMEPISLPLVNLSSYQEELKKNTIELPKVDPITDSEADPKP